MNSMSKDGKAKFLVYTIEECPVDGQKTKRPFQVGDFVTKEGGKCSKCGNPTKITLIYGEPPPKT
jgi:rRNA maturation protein Nop10